MGVLSRIHEVLRTNLSSLIDRATDPAKQVELLIADIEEQKKAATAELIAFKATEKRLAQESAALAAKAADWQKRAEAAVLAGDDALAKEALVEKQRVLVQRAEVERDRGEQARYAAELLRGRRELEQALTSLKLRKGTLAQNLAAARAGGQTALSPSGPAFDALARAEEVIESDAALAEVDAMLGDPLAEGDAVVEAKLREQMKRAQADDALAELKKKMGK